MSNSLDNSAPEQLEVFIKYPAHINERDRDAFTKKCFAFLEKEKNIKKTNITIATTQLNQPSSSILQKPPNFFIEHTTAPIQQSKKLFDIIIVYISLMEKLPTATNYKQLENLHHFIHLYLFEEGEDPKTCPNNFNSQVMVCCPDSDILAQLKSPISRHSKHPPSLLNDADIGNFLQFSIQKKPENQVPSLRGYSTYFFSHSLPIFTSLAALALTFSSNSNTNLLWGSISIIAQITGCYHTIHRANPMTIYPTLSKILYTLLNLSLGLNCYFNLELNNQLLMGFIALTAFNYTNPQYQPSSNLCIS